MDTETIRDLGEEFAEDYIEHYGIKGMKWGKVRSRAQIDADSADVVQVKSAKEKIKTNRTTNVLSNQELQAVVTRMNLEQQYSRLAGPSPAQKQRTDKLKKAGISFVANAAINRVEAPITALAKAKYGAMGEAAVSAAFSQMKPNGGGGKKKKNNNGGNGDDNE